MAFARALYANVLAQRVKQGGSTLTMQTIRLAKDNPKRTFLEKIWEILLAMRLECTYSKTEILNLYVSHAPFGGNVVGLEAAAWRYYGRQAHQLSWGETALLAVLPNSPSLIYPGKNQHLLAKKRNRLLRKLFMNGDIDLTTCLLAEAEPLPQAPKPLPKAANHLLMTLCLEGHAGQRIRSTLHLPKQIQTAALLQHYYGMLKSNSIHNGAILVMEVKTGQVLAYVGNTNGEDPHLGHQVDMIAAKRSFGSLLKPVLYAAMLEEGSLLPHMLVTDVPTNLAGYRPQNFFKEYDGVVRANEVLSRSLNVPSVRMLHQYGVERFLPLVQKMGLTTLTQPASHYGLSIILGGAEATLWELTGMYASMARSVHQNRAAFAAPLPFADSSLRVREQVPLGPTSLYFALDAIAESKRPGSEGQWLEFASSQKIAWKTGTSYGSRDAWSIGVSGKYAVGVWLGNASGEGRPGLTGIGTAAPLLFDVFTLLEKSQPLPLPKTGWVHMPICAESGFKASKLCPHAKDQLVPTAAQKSKPCPYHQLIHLDKHGMRVTSDCESVEKMTHVPWFVLPALQEAYYKPKHPNYASLPNWRSDCGHLAAQQKSMDIIYPRRFSKIYIPRELDGKLGRTVFEAAHRKPNTTIYWHIDEEFLQETQRFHQVSAYLDEGWHTLTLVDADGETQQVKFEVLGKAK